MSEETFLVEIGTEELPPKLLRNLAEEFAYHFTNELNNSIINYGKVNWFATPRRLALKVDHLSDMQHDRKVEKLGPPLSIAFDAEGHPTKEAHGWAHSNSITIDQAECLHTDKGEWLVYRAFIKGKSTRLLIPDMINSALRKLSISKPMRWGASKIQFLRPIHTVTLLLGNELISANIFGVQSQRFIRGHRFIGEQQFIINNADQYPYLLLKRGKVLANYLIRKENIKANIEAAASQLGGIVDLSDNLLEEVTSLVEWPIVLIGKFEKKFLSIPAEALVHTMKVNQKYFPVYSMDGKLLPNFIFVTNIESKDSQQIIIGNEKVIRSRLADAEFFFNIDRKHCLEDNLPRLKSIIFHKHLGTLLDKTVRIQKLADWIAQQIGADINHTNRASMLCKCDLMTKMVCEFTDTQGVIGMYYARYDGEAEDVAMAINEQYYPRFAGDILPSNLVSCAIAIADKMDTLIGIFGVSEHPKGDKDPFALRRAALGILRIIVEKHLPIDLQTLIEKTVSLYEKKLSNAKIIDDVMNFMFGRFRTWYQQEGYNIDVIKAVMARRPTNPVDFDLRIKAISQLRLLKEIQTLIVANKRVSNILAKTTEKLNDNIQVSLLKEDAEIRLATLVYVLQKKLKPYFLEGRYQDALIELAQLSEPIGNFFDNVVVNTNNPEIRINRLTLMAKMRELFLQIADISILN